MKKTTPKKKPAAKEQSATAKVPDAPPEPSQVRKRLSFKEEDEKKVPKVPKKPATLPEVPKEDKKTAILPEVPKKPTRPPQVLKKPSFHENGKKSETKPKKKGKAEIVSDEMHGEWRKQVFKRSTSGTPFAKFTGPNGQVYWTFKAAKDAGYSSPQ